MNSLYSNTPEVNVLDNRSLTVRTLTYYRHPDAMSMTDERITRHTFNTKGSLIQSADPRLHSSGLANFKYIPNLAGQPLRTESRDSGTTLMLNDIAERPLLIITPNGMKQHHYYESAELPGRLLSITEQISDEAPRTTERFVWATSSATEQAYNLSGQCIRHYDTAGRVQTDSISLTGIALSVTQRLLKNGDNADTVANWSGESIAFWDNLLATEAFTTQSITDTTGNILSSTDTAGNIQRMAYNVVGQLKNSWLTLTDEREQAIVASLTYSAAGQKLREEHGNGVVTTYSYEPETQLLIEIKTERPTGHPSGAKILQDLRYAYDPVGNVLNVHNDAEETRYWRNQKVVPEKIYTYDSLYQLVKATGHEMANNIQTDNRIPSITLADNVTYTNYTRTYTYDTAGNLTQIRHTSPATNNNYTTNITVSSQSNRAVISTLTQTVTNVDALFTAGGQQIALQPGQTLSWTARNELREVTPVIRDNAADDSEHYRYNAGSQRITKVNILKTSNSIQTQRVVYLPDLELRTMINGNTETEKLQVITVGEAGSAQVRVLHWEIGKPSSLKNNFVRYSHGNIIGSINLEVDEKGSLLSHEEYYPYGGTAVLTGHSETEVKYKTVRYSGKERDATGLYYYGHRYYQSWIGRWLSADPAGTVDGLNLFLMCRNNPVILKDEDGLEPVPVLNFWNAAHTTVPKGIQDEMPSTATKSYVSLPPATEQNARLAYNTMWTTKGLLGYAAGAGNQANDIFASEGVSAAKTAQLRNLNISPYTQQAALVTLAAGAGLCDEFATVSAHLLYQNQDTTPTFIAHIPGHTFALLGDPRVDQNTQLVDGWVNVPTVLNYSDSLYNSYPLTLDVAFPPSTIKDPRHTLDLESVYQIKSQLFTNDKLNRRELIKTIDLLEDEVMNKIIVRGENYSEYVFNQVTASRDANTHYIGAPSATTVPAEFARVITRGYEASQQVGELMIPLRSYGRQIR